MFDDIYSGVRGINTIKEITPDFFFMRINADMFCKWLQENKSIDGYVDLNFSRNMSEYFYATKINKYRERV